MAFMSRGTERLEKPMQELRDEFDFCIQDQDACGIVNGELANKAFNKGKAVERLCGFLGVSRKGTIAVGDSMNDLEMLREAGVGVAVENAVQAVKDAADYITDTNENDGVAKAIEKIALA